MQYYDDITVGEIRECGDYHITKTEIIEFAEQYDPQPFHTDEEAARDSVFGELVASGWHVAAICMRLSADEMGDEYATIAGIGVDELRWKNPVTPDDMLSLRVEVVDKQPSESKPDRGHIKTRREVTNQDGEIVLSMIAISLVARR
ncbi:MaoC family dehydratase [Halosolutus gelatinilyticus]|uniref:MaoC family dehydratase n=1 Tax=Halosolutus gelatinilyticus TaxID=2931975 RepID=UPI001FF37B99|nr:MaoC family dehydratase [Halosolutus gelatinilyticus]